ncbi:hypothetical protein [Providencia sp. Me31A]|uniref:hypothetical protein n=1 Tax=Providencia sp. Me31A TaxID=3392637 RepID=UPI003D296455
MNSIQKSNINPTCSIETCDKTNSIEIRIKANGIVQNLINIKNTNSMENTMPNIKIIINYDKNSADTEKPIINLSPKNSLINNSNCCLGRTNKACQTTLRFPMTKNIASKSEQPIAVKQDLDNVDVSPSSPMQTRQGANQVNKSMLTEGRSPTKNTLSPLWDTIVEKNLQELAKSPAPHSNERAHFTPLMKNNTSSNVKEKVIRFEKLISLQTNKDTLTEKPLQTKNTLSSLWNTIVEKNLQELAQSPILHTKKPAHFASSMGNQTSSNVKEKIQQFEKLISLPIKTQDRFPSKIATHIKQRTTTHVPATTMKRIQEHSANVQTASVLPSYVLSKTASNNRNLLVEEKKQNNSLALVQKNAKTRSSNNFNALNKSSSPSLAFSNELLELLQENNFKRQMKNSTLNNNNNNQLIEKTQRDNKTALLSSVFNNINNYLTDNHDKNQLHRYIISLDNFQVILTISPKNFPKGSIEGQDITKLLSNYINGLEKHNVHLDVSQQNFKNNSFDTNSTNNQDDEHHSDNDIYFDEHYSDMEDLYSNYDEDNFSDNYSLFDEPINEIFSTDSNGLISMKNNDDKTYYQLDFSNDNEQKSIISLPIMKAGIQSEKMQLNKKLINI